LPARGRGHPLGHARQLIDRRGRLGALLALGLLLSACPGGGGRPAVQPARGGGVPLVIELHPDPLIVASVFSLAGDLGQLQLHLSLRNDSSAPVELERVALRLRRAGQLLLGQELSAELLGRRLRAVPWIVVRDRQSLAAALRGQGALGRPRGDRRLAPGEAASLPYQVLLLRSDETPDELQVQIGLAGGALAERSFPVHARPQLTVLRLPVSGRWWVMQGHRFDEEHAGGALTSQSFAYDLGVLGADGRTYRGDPLRNASYFAHGRPVLAMADGEIVRVQDGVAENEPVGQRPSWEQVMRRPEDLAGNFVVLRHAGGEHSAYLHLRPGLAVAPGARVAAGQPIGRCGNSGNSLEPHLHVQLQDGADPLRAAGLPARFSDFTLELGHLELHVAGPRPLPALLVVQPGRSRGAGELRPLPRR
jgi:murein DD-endopeptidase MepM/ murein hydrolase activator NlpD